MYSHNDEFRLSTSKKGTTFRSRLPLFGLLNKWRAMFETAKGTRDSGFHKCQSSCDKLKSRIPPLQRKPMIPSTTNEPRSETCFQMSLRPQKQGTPRYCPFLKVVWNNSNNLTFKIQLNSWDSSSHSQLSAHSLKHSVFVCCGTVAIG